MPFVGACERWRGRGEIGDLVERSMDSKLKGLMMEGVGREGMSADSEDNVKLGGDGLGENDRLGTRANREERTESRNGGCARKAMKLIGSRRSRENRRNELLA